MQNLNFPLRTVSSESYELLDSGEGEKLERFGEVVVLRPDPQALWQKRMPEEVWQKADLVFEGTNQGRSPTKESWRSKGSNIPTEWKISYGDLTFLLKLTSFKHLGLFPEQLPNWRWLEEVVSKSEEQCSALNLFGYTGGATLALARAGATVTHLDGSKSAVAWASENAEASGLREKSIRWIVDDALTFVEREIKRGKRYDGIVMDPPSFGHGPEGELWKIEEDFLRLFEKCLKLLSEKPKFFLVNGYAAGYSSFAYRNNLLRLQEKFGGGVEAGELLIEESGGGRVLPAGIFARWRG